jgi:murein DD-endopeptidase MepM/ murein hydrolase activator NlpD
MRTNKARPYAWRLLPLGLLYSALGAAALPGEPAETTAVTDPNGLPAPAEPEPTAAPLGPAPGMSDAERQLDALVREERAAKVGVAELGREADQVRARTLARGRIYARAARAGLLPASGGFDALFEHATRVERLRRALGRDLELARRIAERRVELARKLDSVRAQKGRLETELESIKQARTAVLAEQDRALAFASAFSGASAPGDHAAVYGSGVGPTDPSELTSGFAALKGRLPFPIPGRSEIRSSRRADGPGLEMRAPRGTPVRAVYPGRVAFADRYSDYGRTVIVDHGDRFYTVSANLDEVSVKAGDEVTAGSRVGSVGDGPTGALLYFEVRIGTESGDPAEWFGI